MDNADDQMDDAMAPLEDIDFSEDEKVEDIDEMLDVEENEDQQEYDKEDKHVTSQSASTNGQAQAATVSPAIKEREDFLTARQLRIALFALCDGIRQASRDFSTEPKLIKAWLKEARKWLKKAKPGQGVHAEGGERMVEWVLAMREQQLPITETSLFHKASTFKKKGGFSDSFRISYDWAVSFMLRHRLGVQSAGRVATLGRVLPHSLEDKVQCFAEFAHKLVQVHQLPEGAIAAMDELCLFVDFSLMQNKSNAAEALKLCGSSSALLTVFLAALADGTLLPSLVLVKGQPADKALPELVLLEAGADGFSMEEALELWTNRIWLPHTSAPNRPRKGMLVLDRHRDHLSDPFLAAVSGSGTLPAVIPAGCTFRLQPLDVCVKPLLQRVMLSRWATFTAGEQQETSPGTLQANITQLLIDWLVEALIQLAKHPQFLKKSFQLTGLLPGRGKEEETRSPVEAQSHLLSSLAEALLGAEALEPTAPDQQELEDVDEMEEEQDEGEEVQGREEATAQEQEDKEEEGKEAEEQRGKDRKQMEGDGEATDEETDEETEEESKETEEDGEEERKGRREIRIQTGEEVGDEWKMTGESRMESLEAAEEEEDRMETDES